MAASGKSHEAIAAAVLTLYMGCRRLIFRSFFYRTVGPTFEYSLLWRVRESHTMEVANSVYKKESELITNIGDGVKTRRGPNDTVKLQRTKKIDFDRL